MSGGCRAERCRERTHLGRLISLGIAHSPTAVLSCIFLFDERNYAAIIVRGICPKKEGEVTPDNHNCGQQTVPLIVVLLHIYSFHSISIESDNLRPKKMATSFDVDAVRKKFPALQGKQIYFDNAGGSQVLQSVIDS